jgi:hypothetical protein
MSKGEHLQNNSKEDVSKAKIVLQLAKALEADKLNNGYKYIRIDSRTLILKNKVL